MPRRACDPWELFLEVLAFAAHKHRAQRRKDRQSSAYINHPIALARVLHNDGAVDDPVTLCAAILHDTIEDTETSYAELRRAFGREIADVVLEVTDNKRLWKRTRKRLQVERAPMLSGRAKLVKLADKICNLRDLRATPPVGWSAKRKREYFDWARRVVDGLRGAHPGLERAFDREYRGRPR
ncbi:MAG: phosphohydrolase [Betaproteobacteria bacterium RIFCSPLOWO2_02_FULL_66_14]|nr:MAG: phosphohydrolase [Betaproteobacteria bacterium RIFCSPLOWO2_02_FULL_66_14]